MDSATRKQLGKIVELEKKKVNENEVDREIDDLREEVKEILRKTKDKNYTTNLTKEEMRGKKKAMKDKKKVFLPADKGRIMVAMDRYESRGGGGGGARKVTNTR